MVVRVGTYWRTGDARYLVWMWYRRVSRKLARQLAEGLEVKMLRAAW